MDFEVKALLLTREQYKNGDGCGLKSIRKYEDDLVDFVNIGEYFYDNVTSYIIKDDVVYKAVKVFYDLDKKRVIQIAVEDIDPINIMPKEESKESEG